MRMTFSTLIVFNLVDSVYLKKIFEKSETIVSHIKVCSWLSKA